MSRKSIIIGVIIILIFVFASLGFIFHDEIKNYIEEESWIYVTPYIDKNVDVANAYVNGKELMTVNDNYLFVYNKNLETVKTENINSSDIISKSNGSYSVIASKDKNFIKAFKSGKEIWSKELPFAIKEITINKNGFVSVVFLQNGYKSGLKLYNSNGDEILNIYLASTYAVDVEISEDNKKIFVSEVDFNGINTKSNLKTIDVASNDWVVSELGDDEIATDVEISNNNVYLLSNKAIYKFDNQGEKSLVYSFEGKNVIYASIENNKYPFVVESDENVLKTFKDLDYYLSIPEEPMLIDSMDSNIAMCFKNEIWVVNDNCRILKKIKINSGLESIMFFNNGKTLALIHSDKIELVNI
ncbi:MAG: hypothetical protein IKI57_04825 [Clostridia bacterium]|nr:hypothetical protein [Clostridia bacterium]